MGDESYITLKYSMEVYSDSEEECKYIHEYNCSAYKVSDEENQADVFIGKVSVKLFLCSLAQEDGVSLFDVFDYLSTYIEFAELLFDEETEEIKDEWADKEYWYENVLVLDRIEILPEFRGQGFCKKITKTILDHFSGCYGLALLKAYPLQLELFDNDTDEWRKRMGYENMEKDPATACKQLYSFYRKIGLKRFKRSEFFYYNPKERR